MKMKLHTLSEEEKKEPGGNGRRLNPVEGCPLTAAVVAIGGKWKLIIVYWLGDRPRHFAGLRRLTPGISQKVLTEQLRQLVDDGIVARHPSGAIPSPVEYELTAYGTSLLPIVDALRAWGRGHLERGMADEQIHSPHGR
jgi:DNA-binding HxlR family transcriptional regulator